VAINPNDPFSDPLRPGGQAFKTAQDQFQAGLKRDAEIRAATAKTTADTIKRNQDIAAENVRRNAFTSRFRGSSDASADGVGVAAGVLLLPIAFLAVIAFVIWKLVS